MRDPQSTEPLTAREEIKQIIRRIARSYAATALDDVTISTLAAITRRIRAKAARMAEDDFEGALALEQMALELER